MLIIKRRFERELSVAIIGRASQHSPESTLHLTLTGLAYNSGFNSKTVFNTYFKKETGLTPNEFLKLQK